MQASFVGRISSSARVKRNEKVKLYLCAYKNYSVQNTGTLTGLETTNTDRYIRVELFFDIKMPINNFAVSPSLSFGLLRRNSEAPSPEWRERFLESAME